MAQFYSVKKKIIQVKMLKAEAWELKNRNLQLAFYLVLKADLCFAAVETKRLFFWRLFAYKQAFDNPFL